jgi:DNA polymerase-1
MSDTMHLAQLLGASGDTRPQRYYSLEGVVERELGLGLDKTLQKSDWSGEVSHEQLLYAARDAAAELPLFHLLTAACAAAGLDRIRALEEACLPALAWMEAAGVLVDDAAWMVRSEKDVLELGILAADLCTLLHDAHAQGVVLPQAPEAVNWNSPAQILQVLHALGADHITSTGELLLTQLAPDYPFAARFLEYRHMAQRIKNGGAKWLRDWIHPITHRVHAEYFQIGSRAGRMSCAHPNMQQIPKSRDYRTSIIAGPGNVLLKADYGQLQLRLAAVAAPEPIMRDAFRDKKDLHKRTAAYVLGLDEAVVTEDQRTLAKAINFGLLFGMGDRRFREETRKKYKIELSPEEARHHRDAFFKLYPGLRAWHRATGAVLRSEGAIEARTPLGRRRTNLQRYTECLNTPIQGAEADGFKLAVARLYAHRHEVPEARLIMCVHDEIVAEAPAAHAADAAAWLTRHMQAAMDEVVKHEVPIEVEVKIGKDWAGTPLDTGDAY